jgi:hypothetical protein
LKLTDELIEGAIDSITGYIVAKDAKKFNTAVPVMMERFLSSNTYSLLADPGTGLYWDSLAETENMFLKELRTEK